MPGLLDAAGGLWLARGAADAAVLSGFGATLFMAAIASGEREPAAGRGLAGLVRVSLAASAVLTALWAALQAQGIAGSVLQLPVVLGATLFGHLVLARMTLLGLAALAATRAWRGAAAALTGLAAASLAGHGHALAMDEGPSWLLASEVLHLLAAGAWLGGLAPLLILVATTAPATAAMAASRFSRLATACVLAIAATALVQSWTLIGSLPGLIGTAYGQVALAKLALFLVLLGFAARHRFRLTPTLAGLRGGAVRPVLVRSIAAETGVGLLTVLAAGLLTSLMPAMHAQPLWPFAWRPSLDAAREDPDVRVELLLAAAGIAAAALLTAASFVLRWRLRFALALLLAVTCWQAAPHLEPLLVPAYLTQYWHSPTGFSSASIAAGGALYPQYCAGCHGAHGRGDGPAAAGLPVPPADLTAPHLWAHADGELFWWLSDGIAAPDGRPAMPAFAGILDEDQRWALIDWVRANNAGIARTRMPAATGAWPLPVPAPGLDLACAEPAARDLAAWRGHVVRLVFGPAAPVAGAVTVAVDPGSGAAPGPGLCLSADPAAPLAYATVTGLAPDALRGAEILIDGGGWLRAVRLPGTSGDTLAAAIASIAARPLQAGPPSHAGMRM